MCDEKLNDPKIGGFRGNWKKVDFTPNGIHNLPDGIIVTAGTKVIETFSDLNAFSSWLGDKASKKFKIPGLAVETSVIKGKMTMRSAGGKSEIREKLAEQGIVDDNGVKMVNGMLHELGYRAKLAGALYGVRGSGGKRLSNQAYEADYNTGIINTEETLFGLEALPPILMYPDIRKKIIAIATSSVTLKEAYIRTVKSEGKQAGEAALLDAVRKARAHLVSDATDVITDVVKRKILKIQKSHSKDGIDAEEFFKFLGTTAQIIRGVGDAKTDKHKRLQKTVEVYVDEQFKGYLQELEARKKLTNSNQLFSDEEIAEADKVKVTREDITMIRTKIDLVINQKTFEGYIVSRGDLMKLLQIPVVEEIKKLNAGDYREFENAMTKWLDRLVNDNFEKFDELLQHPDPRDIKSRDMIRILREKVVRVVFRKRDGSIRIMHTTRNKELIEKLMAVKSPKTYKPSPEVDAWEEKDKIEAQIAGDYIRVLDIAKAEFRSFKPSSLQRFDSEVNVGAWMEFDIADDAWYDMIFNGRSANHFYVNHRNAKHMGEKLKERQEFEKKAYMIINGITEGESEAAATVVEDKSKAAAKFALEYLKSIKGKDYGEGFEKVQKALRTLPNGLNNLGKLQEKGYVAKITQEDKDSGLLIMEVGTDKFFIHPHFLVNITSGKVYADKPDVFKLGRANQSDVDVRAGALLDRAGEIIQGTRRQMRRNASANDADVKRMNRLKQFIELHPDTFKEAGVQARVVEKDGNAVAEFSFSGARIFANPEQLVMFVSETKKTLYKRVRHTSTSSEMAAALGNVKFDRNPALHKRFVFVRDVLFTTFDLRKQIN
ncbi:hypothetical protein [Bacillus mycoides]|uniref:hypothetical protein n=1 Tax=Bacillus mycoides TaxID=1405 RepID=UPI003A80EB76